MKPNSTPGVLLALCLTAVIPLQAQQPVGADSVQAALAGISARLDSLERGSCPSAPGVAIPAGNDSVRVALGDLNARLERLIAARCGGQAAAPPDAGDDELAALRAAAAEASGGAAPVARVDSVPDASTKFVGRQRNASSLNPEISATGDIRLNGRLHGDLSGEAREFEVALQSTLDPYSTGKIFLTFEHDEVGVEEGYLYWTGLPGRLRADVGLFRQQVGELNRWHLHALPESDYPLVYRRFLGAEGLSGAGLSLYTSLPFSIAHGTHEIWLQGTTAESDALYGDGRHGTLLGRVQNFWQLNRSTYGQIGFTALGGDHGDSLESRVLGLDLRLTWRPPNAGTRQDVTFRAEGYRLHRNELGRVTSRYGAYADLAWRASRRWILGARYDWVETPGGPYAKEWQISPTITWWESEFVYLRLEGQHHRTTSDTDRNRLLFQVVFAMGPHKHETY